MDARMEAALKEYSEKIQAEGHAAGETLIVRFEEQYTDFRKWANAVAIFLRGVELLDD